MMSEKNKDKQFFSVGRIFFLLVVIPLSLMAILIANGIFKVGDMARQGAMTVLDQKAQEEIKTRAITVAEEVASFLKEREKDVLVATIIPPTEGSYKDFMSKNTGALWMKKDGQIVRVAEPLYTEMALIDNSGNEVIRISGGKVVSRGGLRNVANPANTTYKSEDYFAKAKALGRGEVYVSHPTGWYVNKQDFAKGKRFDGIVRFATPVFDKSGASGVVELALDMRHLMKFTDNIIPTQSGYVLEADASTGNYAFMVDNRGLIISHPNDFHIEGLNPDGTPVPPLTAENQATLTKEGKEVLDLNLLGFMDPGLPAIAKDAAAGNAGMKQYKFAGLEKFVAYAPIKFYASSYPKPAGFGWIGMGVDVGKFNEFATLAGKKIQAETKAWTTTIVVIIIASVVLLFLIMALLTRGISRSIASDVPEGSEAPVFDDDED
jgi:hypothetical protein